MGTTDIGGKTATVVDQVLAAAPDCGLDVVIGEDAPSLDHVEELARRNKRIAIHKDSRAMAGLMRDADLAVGAAGVTALERCCLGLPSIALVVADNQRSGAEALERSEASVIANVETLGKALDDLISDPTRRARMSAAAFAITEGMGTSRVVQAMDDRAPRQRTPLSVRSATLADSEILWLWRNDPLMREMSKNRAPIIWEDHERWLATVLSNPCVGLYMADRSGEPVAMVRFDRKDDLAIVSTNVAPAMRGQGIGTAALKAACETYEAESRTAHLVAEVRHDNAASLRAFAAAGFRRMKSTDPKFATLMRETVSEGEAKGR